MNPAQFTMNPVQFTMNPAQFILILLCITSVGVISLTLLLCITSGGVISLSLLDQIIASSIYIGSTAFILDICILFLFTSYPIYLINSANERYVNIKIQKNFFTTIVSYTIIRNITIREYGDDYPGESHTHVTNTYIGYPIIITCGPIVTSVLSKISSRIRRIKRVSIIDAPIYR